MAFYQNLKIIMDNRGLTSYAVSKKCNLAVQTVDNMIKNKVKKPTAGSLNKLSVGLEVSVSELMYGSEKFDTNNFFTLLQRKDVTIETIAIETNLGYEIKNIREGIMPSMLVQEQVGVFLDMNPEEIFIPVRTNMDLIKPKNVKPYIRPDLNSDLILEHDFFKLYKALSVVHKKLLYNMAYDLATLEGKYVINYTEKDYWEK